MDSLTRIVTIKLGPRSYPVHIGENLLDEAGRICRRAGLRGRAAIISDRKVGELYGDRVSAALTSEGFKVPLHLVNPGETSKSFAAAAALCEDLAGHGVDRQSFVVALGGGVIGDLAGFVAAIYYRGVPFIQIPTTIMAQVDSSIGGKTGVNLSAGKNLVGAFHQPVAVLADTTTLATLGRREWNEGLAEVIKYGVIREKGLLAELRDGKWDLADLVRRCVEIKASFVEEDERETTGSRALLNYGHTLGHAIEAVAGYGTLLHGEAVALGMVAAAHLSSERAGLQRPELEELVSVIRRFDLPIELPDRLSRSQILEKGCAAKKFVNGKNSFALTPNLGSAVLVGNLTVEYLEFGLRAIDPTQK